MSHRLKIILNGVNIDGTSKAKLYICHALDYIDNV